MSTSTQTLRIAVVNAPYVAEGAAESGAEILSDDDFRAAVRLIQRDLDEGGRIDAILVGDAQVVGLRGWIRHISRSVPTAIVRSYSGMDSIDGVDQVSLPRALDEVLRIAGADATTGTYTMLEPDPAAPRPEAPRAFPAVTGSAPAPRPTAPEPEPSPEPEETMSYQNAEPPTTEMAAVDIPQPPQAPPPQQPAQPQQGSPMPPQQWQGHGQPQSPMPSQQWAEQQQAPQSPSMPPQQWQGQPQSPMPSQQPQWPGQQWPQGSAPMPPQQWPGQSAPPPGAVPVQWPGQQGWPVQQGGPPQQWQGQPQPQQAPPMPQQSQPGWQGHQGQPAGQPVTMGQGQTPQPAPAGPPSDEADMFFSASKSQTMAPIVVVGAWKGGVGKTSNSLGIAQRGAEKGLKVVLVDANMGQGGSVSVRLRIHKSDGLPTIYDAAITNTPRRAIVPPNEINNARNQIARLDEIHFALIQAPTSETSSKAIVTNDVYLDAIRFAQRQADLVVIDTQIIEAEAHRPDSLFWDKLVPLIRSNEAWFIAVTEDDRESVKNTLDICRVLSEQKEVQRSHILTVFNLFDPGVVNPRAAHDSMKRHSVPVGVIDRVDAIKKRFSAGYTPTSIPEFLPILDNILRIVTGDTQRFPRYSPEQAAQERGEALLSEQHQHQHQNQHQSEEPKRKRGFFARLFGRK